MWNISLSEQSCIKYLGSTFPLSIFFIFFPFYNKLYKDYLNLIPERTFLNKGLTKHQCAHQTVLRWSTS